MRQLLEAGVHFGHQTRRWNPKMKRFIFGERNGIYIIDLNQTLQRVDSAYSFVRDMVAGGGSILFIGTKKQSQDPISRAAEECGMPYVNERWLGGMLTNFATIAGRVKKMQEYERMRASGDFEAMPKKEALILGRELEKLERNLGGIRNMNRLPDAVFIIDIKKEHIAVSEANKIGIPIVAVVDTNCDPDLVQFPIPGNDDAIRSGTLMCHVIAEAVGEGRFIASRRGPLVSAAPAPAMAYAGAPAGPFAHAGTPPAHGGPSHPHPGAPSHSSAPAHGGATGHTVARTAAAHTTTTHTPPTHTAPTHTAPAHTAAAQTAPAHTARPHAEPTASPTDAGPTDAEPTHAEPTHAEPTHAEPTHAEPTDAGRTSVGAAPAAPAAQEPAAAETPQAVAPAEATESASVPGQAAAAPEN
jgi:small subunit ribosomal protein S2